MVCFILTKIRWEPVDMSSYSFCDFHSGQLSMGPRSTGMFWDIFNIGKSHFVRTPSGSPLPQLGLFFPPKETLDLSMVAHRGPGQARPALESGSQALTKKAAGSQWWPWLGEGGYR